MSGNLPKGGKWSFDSENRKKIPKNIKIPSLLKIIPLNSHKGVK